MIATAGVRPAPGVWGGMGDRLCVLASLTLLEMGRPPYPEQLLTGWDWPLLPSGGQVRVVQGSRWWCTGAGPDGLPCALQHYTSDADGLCTRLIKPKVMEGTVAAQDEFFRSECHPHPCPSVAHPPPPPPRLPGTTPIPEALETSREPTCHSPACFCCDPCSDLTPRP